MCSTDNIIFITNAIETCIEPRKAKVFSIFLLHPNILFSTLSWEFFLFSLFPSFPHASSFARNKQQIGNETNNSSFKVFFSPETFFFRLVEQDLMRIKRNWIEASALLVMSHDRLSPASQIFVGKSLSEINFYIVFSSKEETKVSHHQNWIALPCLIYR